MPPVSNSSSTPNPKDIADVEAGLAALKQGDLAQAIALLQSHSLPHSHPLNIKAQMGLVSAYARNGNPTLAASLCQTLEKHSNPQVRAWATRNFSSLIKRHPEVAELQAASATEEDLEQASLAVTKFAPHVEDPTGFVPLDPAALSSQLSESQPLEPEVNPSGFVPLGAAPPAPVEDRPDADQPDATGFVPLQPTARTPVRSNTSLQTPATTLQAPGTAEVIPPATLEAAPPNYEPVWRQAGRAKNWQPLGAVKWQAIAQFVLLQVFTVVSLFWMICEIPFRVKLAYHETLIKIPLLHHTYEMFSPPSLTVLLLLIILFCSSRWLLDGLLKWRYGLKRLSLSQLAKSSPETAQSLQRFCRQSRLPMPALGVLSLQAPVAFSYGCLPWVTRIVVSQGLLEQLADDEIATIYASEIGHIASWDTPVMSLIAVVLQIPYTLYALLADGGDRLHRATWYTVMLRGVMIPLSAISYGVYALLRWIVLWLSRRRVYYSDRLAAGLTGNPNGFTRALLKIAIGTSQTVQAEGKTSYLLEGLDVLMPLGHRIATTLGSLYPYTSMESVLLWDWMNPYSHWLSLNNSHPPTGDRLSLLSLYARHWKLDNELEFDTSSTQKRRQKAALTGRQWKTLLLQGAPFFGLIGGLAIALLLSSVGWIADKFNVISLAWLSGDFSTFIGLPLMGFSFGTFLRINFFFPDINFSNRIRGSEVSPSLVELLRNPASVPVDSIPIRLEGKLIGRAGFSNWLSQDLLLQTSSGIVRLHCLSPWGPIGNLLPQEVHPTDLLNQELVVTGWFRRGAMPWIDVELLRTAGGRTNRSQHPIWSTVFAILLAIWGTYTIATGGLPLRG